MLRLSVCLATITLASTSSAARCAFTSTTAPFAPITFREGFEVVVPVGSCVANMFLDTAITCAVPPNTIGRIPTLTMGLCTVTPKAGGFFANLTGGSATLTFGGRRVEEFGGWFNTIPGSTVTLDFYSSGTLLGSSSAATGCGTGWVWIGGKVDAPACFIDTVVISDAGSGAVQMDELFTDFYTDGPVSYCEPTITSGGCAGTLAWADVAGIAGGNLNFTVTASGLEKSKSTIFFYGIVGPQKVPFGSCVQYLCVKPTVWRLGLQNSRGAAPCSGSATLNFDAWMKNIAPPSAPGAPFLSVPSSHDYYIQAWFRDPSNPCTASGTTNALVFRLVD